jgi:hypothetical protein
MVVLEDSGHFGHIEEPDAFAAAVIDPLSPPLRHDRERHELQRLRRILDAHSEEEPNQ